MTSLKATKTIASTNKYVISAIGIYTSFPEVSKQPPPFPYKVIIYVQVKSYHATDTNLQQNYDSKGNPTLP